MVTSFSNGLHTLVYCILLNPLTIWVLILLSIEYYCRYTEEERSDKKMMTMKLSTTLSHITTVPNSINSKVLVNFIDMKSIGTSENH